MKLKQGLNYAHKASKGHRQFYLDRNTSERAVDVELGSNLLITKLKLVIIKFFSSPAFAVAAPVCGIHFLFYYLRRKIYCVSCRKYRFKILHNIHLVYYNLSKVELYVQVMLAALFLVHSDAVEINLILCVEL